MIERVKLNRSGVRSVLTSTQVESELRRIAEQAASTARSRGVLVENKTVPIPVEVRTSRSGNRAHAYVVLAHPAGLAVEAKYRLLGGSV